MLAIYPLQLSPAALGVNYDSLAQPITAVGGTGPYSWSFSGSLPPGMSPNLGTGDTAVMAGRPLVADQYANVNFIPVCANPSTFTLSVTDSSTPTPRSASITYTLPVGLFTEKETISIYQMYQAVYPTDYYIVLSVMGTREVKIGDIGNTTYGGIRLVINAALNNFTQGMVQLMREHVIEWDKIKWIAQEQKNSSVEGVTGIDHSWQKKRQLILTTAKSMLPAFTLAEIKAYEQRGGGNDSIGSNSMGTGGTSVTLIR